MNLNYEKYQQSRSICAFQELFFSKNSYVRKFHLITIVVNKDRDLGTPTGFLIWTFLVILYLGWLDLQVQPLGAWHF